MVSFATISGELNTYELALANQVLVFTLKAICLILGYLVVRLGHRLIESGVKGEFKFHADYKGLRAGLVSVSPGLLFVLLGVALMGYAIYVSKVTEVDLPGSGGIRPPVVDLPGLQEPALPNAKEADGQ